MNRTTRPLLALALLCLLLAAPSMAQQAQTGSQVIQPGHLLTITVLGSDDLTQQVAVREDGTTNYPILGNIPVDGLTPEDLSQLLNRVLSRIMERPEVFVSVSDFRLITARVVGAVQSPGTVQLEGPVDIQSVLERVGGTEPNADRRNISIVREVNGERQVREVNLAEYLQQSVADFEPVMIETGDMIVVPLLQRESFARVLGAVRSPGSYVPQPGETVLDLIYRAGGPDNRANLDEVYFYTRGPDGQRQEQVLDLTRIEEDPDSLPFVQPGDVISVDRISEFVTLSFWASTLRDVALIISSVIVLSQL